MEEKRSRELERGRGSVQCARMCGILRDSVKVWWAVKIKVWKKGAKCTKTFKINKINLR